MSATEYELVEKVDRSGHSIPLVSFMFKGEPVTCKRGPTTKQFKPLAILKSLEDFTPREDDIWILSYPKSGCHWLYEMVGILLSHKLQPLSQYKEEAFLEHAEAGMEYFDDLPSPRILNTHIRLKFMPKTLFIKDPLTTVAELCQFLELERIEAFCEGVVKHTSIGFMVTAKGKSDNELNTKAKELVRKGSTTDWKIHFTVAENEEFDRFYAEKMREYPELINKIKFS